jgi:uncharacterized lipoprotein YmbA
MKKLGLIIALLSLVSCASTRKNFERAQGRQTASLTHIAIGHGKILGRSWSKSGGIPGSNVRP